MPKSKSKATRNGLGGSPTHLLHRALQLALDFHAEAAGPAAVTQRQFTVLAAAAEAEGLTQNDLVRATGIDRSTLADLVARMLTKGLLERERSVTDARANTVRLSPAGRAALTAAADAARSADQRLLSVVATKKREGFIKSLAALAEAADMAPADRKPASGGKVDKKKKKKPKKVKDVGA